MINLDKGKDKGKGKAQENISSGHDRNVLNEADECEVKKLVQGQEPYYGTKSMLWDDVSGKSGGNVLAVNNDSGRLIHSGHIFEIQMPTKDAKNMKVMLDFQWACIQISVMSGAAGWPDFLTEDDDDGSDDWVGEWLERTSFTSPPNILADPRNSRDMSPEKRLRADPETSPE
jgi:hypothetical protein